jgi:5-methylcytosine-specific restriction endonuclease McrA
MSYETKFENWREMVEESSKSSKSALEAAAKLGIKYDTYKKYALKYNCFITNQSGKGHSKNMDARSIPLEEILAGQHPSYHTFKLKNRLIEKSILKEICANCGNSSWLEGKIPLELDHINGVASDHRLENLRLLCPNCHSLTPTYRGKNKGRTE